MKRLFSLLLCLCLLLTGCAPEEKEIERQEEKPISQETGGYVVKELSEYALAEVALPAIPAAPTTAEWEQWCAEHDPAKMSSEAYDKAYRAYWKDRDAREEANRAALDALRGDGVPAALAPAFAAYTRQSAAQLFGESTEKNVIYSPANLYLALALLSAVTEGETQGEVLALLGLPDAESAAKAAGALWKNLYSDGGESKTTLANSVWLREGDTYKQATLDRLAEDFFASAYAVPMGTAEADGAIAAWINDHTGGLLREAAGALQTAPETVLALISALYFRDQWVSSFSAHATAEDVFTKLDGSERRVDFMHKTQDRGVYRRVAGGLIASLPFRGGARMTFLLPDVGVDPAALLRDEAAFEAFLTFSGERDETAEDAKLVWSVPKFDVDSNVELSAALRALGVTAAFDELRADFSPVADFPQPVVLAQVQHAARVKVDEDGCEAAAFTAMMVNATAMMPPDLPEIAMDLSHPFAFLITGADGLPLFLGTVAEP